MKTLLPFFLLLYSTYGLKAQSCPPLNPGNDGTGIAVDLLMSEINPGDYIELYNTTTADIALSSILHQFCSPFNYKSLSSLAPTTVVPAKGYATVPWPANFTDTDAGGEVILYKNGTFSTSSNIIDYVCWGTNPHGSRKLQAENVGKWTSGSPCAGVLTNGAIHRIAGTTGVSASSYIVTAAPSPLNCAPDPCVGVTCSDMNPCTTDSCSNGQCIFTPLDCNDHNACTTDDCLPFIGCISFPLVCDDSDPCTNDTCIIGQCSFIAIQCDDGDFCTSDFCINGQCEFFAVNCDDGIPCTSDSCDNGNCINTPVSCFINISGAIFTELDSPVGKVIVALSGTSASNDTIGAGGLFSFEVSPDSSYTITPSKNNDSIPNNGVSTLDILLMQRHILNSQALGSPYKIIAADVNGSGSVTTLDIVLTRALILANITTFQNGKLWEFVPDDHVFGDLLNPFPFPKNRSYANKTESQINQNFIGIKLGDVNGSWDSLIP